MITSQKLLAVISPILILGISTLNAVVSPDNFVKPQNKAPEAITIKITSQKTTPHKVPKGRKSKLITLEAVVTSVTRSATKLKKGDKIVISYLHRVPDEESVGFVPIPILEKDKTYPAWLKKSENEFYSPAARHYSFKTIPPQFRKAP